MPSPKRTLPLYPNADYLRKQAKARLAEMKARVPSARLADAQFALAREYGFANWAALQAEAARYGGARARRGRFSFLDPARFHLRAPTDLEAEGETLAAFFRAGVAAQIGFILAALAGVSLLFLADGKSHAVVACLGRLARIL